MSTDRSSTALHGSVNIRPAVESDIEATTRIINHYILNTTANFAEDLVSLDNNLSSFRKYNIDGGLPYLVAEQDGETQGYIKLSPFRPGTGGGYWPSTELSLFVDPTRTSSGIGTLLLNKLLHIIQHPDSYDHTWLGEKRRGEHRVRSVISCMGCNPNAPDGGEGLARYYERFGFERVGRLKGIAVKFGVWYVVIISCLSRVLIWLRLDTIYLQKRFP